MGGIHSDYIHPRKEEFAKEIDVATAIANRAYDLGLFHFLGFVSFLQRYGNSLKR
jgi:hypothetical protein